MNYTGCWNGIAIVGGSILVSLAVVALARRLFPHEELREGHDATGNLLTGSQYQQQLMQDANIQKTYGWVKYGMDFSAWTAQKLQSRTAFGRDINDAEAATILQYGKSASGSNMSVTAKQTGGQQWQ